VPAGIRAGACSNRAIDGGTELAFGGGRYRIDLKHASGGKTVTVYRQTEVTHDLMDARGRAGLITISDAADLNLNNFDSDRPRARYANDGATHEIACDFIAGRRQPPTCTVRASSTDGDRSSAGPGSGWSCARTPT
jgi:p-hydroxybenzoate 3-monooxygenase